MKFIIERLKPFWKVVLAIIALQVVRSYTTLLLPEYTSGLVDTGIQNQGIEYAVPSKLTRSDYEELAEWMLPQEEEVWRQAYQEDINGGYSLAATYAGDEEALQSLNDRFSRPLALYNIYSSWPASQQADMEEAIQRELAAGNQLEDIRPDLEAEYLTYTQDQINNLAIQASGDLMASAGVDLQEVQRNYLISNGLQMLGIALATLLISLAIFYLASRTGAEVGYKLRQDIFGKVLAFSEDEIQQFSTASLITRSTNDIQQVQQIIIFLLRAILFSPVLAIGGVIRIVNTQVELSWILALAVIVISIVVFTLYKITMPKFRIVQKLFDKVNLVAREILTGLQVIRAFGRQKYETKRFDEANSELQSTHLFIGRVMSLTGPVLMLIANVVSILVVWASSHRIAGGQMQVGQMMAFITYSMQVVFSFLQLSMVSIMLPRSIVSANRIQEVLDTPSTITDPQDPVRLNDPQGRLTFKEVDFCYQDASEKALSDISFTAEPGQTTAIIGATGSGKSTILNLLMRFYDVSAGAIEIDGVDIRQLSQKDLHEMIGYVPQQGVLFSGTVRSNIGFGVDDLSDENMLKAARIAHADEFVENIDQGYDSHIAQGGSNVSGGQKQRLSIARAIAKDPAIYLFDDSFSALDYQTDANVRKALNESVGDATVIIVAQRVSTIMNAEKIIVLDEGKIETIGSHQELLDKSPIYREIAESQLSAEELSGQEGREEDHHGEQ